MAFKVRRVCLGRREDGGRPELADGSGRRGRRDRQVNLALEGRRVRGHKVRRAHRVRRERLERKDHPGRSAHPDTVPSPSTIWCC